MASSTVENYLKHVYLIGQTSDQDLVAMGQLATAMEVTPGTATSMIKALSDAELVRYEPRAGVALTPQGEKLALHVLRRHRLVELFLVNVLGLSWTEVHAEAEELEHAISDKVLERIDTYLDHPSVDPHGDPIPPATGVMDTPTLASLADCPLTQPTRIARVLDQDPGFLKFVDRSGLTPGRGVVVQHRDPAADAVTITPDSQPPVTLGTHAASKILVESE